jgi:hypothetical protein
LATEFRRLGFEGSFDDSGPFRIPVCRLGTVDRAPIRLNGAVGDDGFRLGRDVGTRGFDLLRLQMAELV